ncbi:transcription initiation factor TFIID component TAF4 family-domain-containing protein [Abortiporus biennis]|nr:transcription initiation factor TFIID component TAF4 family-domain-containing protein [Abortiporus biennis]
MKTEQENTQQPTQTTFSAAQWGQTQIPIDPALQQQQPQHQHPTTTYSHYAPYQHYPQATYGHYQYAPPPQQTQQVQQQQPQPMATIQVAPQPAQQVQSVTTTIKPQQPVAASAPASNPIDTADISTLNDALGSAGVDLRAEEESLHRTSDQYYSYRPYEDRSRKQPAKPNFDVRILGPTIREKANKHKVTKVPDDSVNYIALSLRARLEDLVTAMIAAAHHRTDTQFDRAPSLYDDNTPMWNLKIRSDVAKQIAVIERIEREEEMKVRRERKERIEAAAAHAAALQAQAAGAGVGVSDGMSGGLEESEGPKKKKKKEGPGVTARNMSEDVRKKMSNAVASQAAGLGTGKYAWMNAAAAPAAPKPKPAAPTTSTAAASSAAALTPATTTTPVATTPSGSGSWARPYVSAKGSHQATPPKEDENKKVVTLKDAMFVVENERGHGGGRGAARGWT